MRAQRKPQNPPGGAVSKSRHARVLPGKGGISPLHPGGRMPRQAGKVRSMARAVRAGVKNSGDSDDIGGHDDVANNHLGARSGINPTVIGGLGDAVRRENPAGLTRRSRLGAAAAWWRGWCHDAPESGAPGAVVA